MDGLFSINASEIEVRLCHVTLCNSCGQAANFHLPWRSLVAIYVYPNMLMSDCSMSVVFNKRIFFFQVSVLRPILFVCTPRIPDIERLIECHNLCPHLLADDTQVYGPCSPSQMDDLAVHVTECADEILSFMQCNRLQLNSDNTGLIYCAMSRRLQKRQTTLTRVGSQIIPLSSSVCDLGVYIDADFSMLLTFNRQPPVALQLFIRFVAFVSYIHLLRYSCSSCCLFQVDLIT